MLSNNPVLVRAMISSIGQLHPISLECLNIGRQIADTIGSTLAVLVMANTVSSITADLQKYPIDTIYCIEAAELATYHPDYHLAAVVNALEIIKPQLFLSGHTFTEIDLAPRIAYQLGCGIVTDCVGIKAEKDELIFSKPVFSGHVIAEYAISSLLAIATLRSKSYEPIKPADKRKSETIPLDIHFDDVSAQYQLMDTVHTHDDGPKLESADIIVAGGRGIGSQEGFKPIYGLAETLGAAVGASRPPVDLKWISAACQVGQTGAIVAPSLYIAIAISGSTQHIAGMAESKVIVAINSNEDAGIFKISDFGVVGNYEEIVPALNNEIQMIRKGMPNN